jgi:hypothetical protein
MRKILSLLVVLILASSFVLAQQGIHEPGTGLEDPELKEAGQGTGQGLDAVQTATQNQAIDAQLQNRIMTEEGLGEQERQRLQTGLEMLTKKLAKPLSEPRNQSNILVLSRVKLPKDLKWTRTATSTTEPLGTAFSTAKIQKNNFFFFFFNKLNKAPLSQNLNGSDNRKLSNLWCLLLSVRCRCFRRRG